jgi:adenosylcobinamide-phosphate synthase
LRDALAKRAAFAAAVVVADRLIAQPRRLHPVRLYGKYLELLERVLFRPSRASGIAYALLATVPVVAASSLLPRVAEPAALFFCLTCQGLLAEVERVLVALEDGQLGAARQMLSLLVTRDTSEMGPDEIVASLFETLTENANDSFVGPLAAYLVGGLPAAVLVRAADTCDSMVGYRTERHREFGWASARVDDLLACPGALATAAGVALLAGRPASLISAFKEAVFAASFNAWLSKLSYAHALDVSLGGPVTYFGERVDRPRRGGSRKPSAQDLRAALSLTSRLRWAAAFLALAIAVISWLAPRWVRLEVNR